MQNNSIDKYLTNGRYDRSKSAKVAQSYKEQNSNKGVGVSINDNNTWHNSGKLIEKLCKK
jgi:hypothetical protein